MHKELMIAIIASLCGMQVFSKSWKMRHIAVCLISECQGKWKDAELSKGEERATGFRHTLSLLSRRQLNGNPK